MKKLVFALQVFALVIFLPAYVIVEMNHGTPAVQEVKIITPVTQEMRSSTTEMSMALISCPMTAAVFNQVIQPDKKDHKNAACTCANCTCGSACFCAGL